MCFASVDAIKYDHRYITFKIVTMLETRDAEHKPRNRVQ